MRINISELKPQINRVWMLSVPAILTQITTIAMQYIDSAMVGNLGANASAAIGLALLLVPLYGIHGMWIAMAVELCVRGLLLLYRLMRSKYLRPATKEETK